MAETDREQAQLRRDANTLLRSPAGKRLMREMKKRFCGQTYVKDNTHETAFREGRRYMVDWIKNLLGDEPPEEQEEG